MTTGKAQENLCGRCTSSDLAKALFKESIDDKSWKVLKTLKGMVQGYCEISDVISRNFKSKSTPRQAIATS